MKFEGDRGAAFFRSTLVQTLFYGIFSAWVLWARQTPVAKGAVRLARFCSALACAGHPGAVLAALQPRTAAAVGTERGAGLDGGGPGPGGPRGLLRQVQRGRGGALLLRAVPRGIRPGPAQADGRLVHPRRGGALHGGPRRPCPEGRPGHRGRAGRRERLRPGPLLRHRRLPGRDTEAHRRQPAGARDWAPSPGRR